MTSLVPPVRQDLPRPFGPYELVRRLASGAVAEVWLARARSVAGFEKPVALKMVHAGKESQPEIANLLIEEARLTARLGHRNIVQVIDLGQVDGRHYIAMEFVDGMDLARLLKRLRAREIQLSPRVAAYVAREVAEGLEHAHRRADGEGNPLHIVHRDVSPANVLVSFDGEVKLTDFGLAKSSTRAPSTQAGVIKGKYAYMAPEQARAQSVDARADVFSATAVLYEMLTGQAPYPDAPLPVLLERVTRGMIDPPEKLRGDIPEPLRAVLRKGLAADPAHRFASARALADALNAWLFTQAPSPEMELSRALEAAVEGARNVAGPLGALIVDDDSEEITDIEAHKKIRQRVEETGDVEAEAEEALAEGDEPEARTVFQPVALDELRAVAEKMERARAAQRASSAPPPPPKPEPEPEPEPEPDGVSSTVMMDPASIAPPSAPPRFSQAPAPQGVVTHAEAMPVRADGAIWGAAPPSNLTSRLPAQPPPARSSAGLWVAAGVALLSVAALLAVLLRAR